MKEENAVKGITDNLKDEMRELGGGRGEGGKETWKKETKGWWQRTWIKGVKRGNVEIYPAITLEQTGLRKSGRAILFPDCSESKKPKVGVKKLLLKDYKLRDYLLSKMRHWLKPILIL